MRLQKSPTRPNPIVLCLLIALMAMSYACGEDGTHDIAKEMIEVSGTWTTSFGGTEIITAERWDLTDIVTFDNTARWAVTQNDADAEFSPGKFNRFVWTPLVNDSFYYCWADFALDSAELAESSDAEVDATNPDEDGCGGFSWTKMTRQ
ncbi:MAG: hypothetical protein H0U74_13265 [Bradymonadaceae bacterium]|nr:hypothetical protein [Lujinxingiaceae bacterium]